jgi:acetyl-CoA carboxylase beta subunit/acetyl-CoA carboxylase alpha subunit
MTTDRPTTADQLPEQAGHRALYREVADPRSLSRFGEEIEAGNPSDWPEYSQLLSRARVASGSRHAVTTGTATIGGQPCVLVGFEYAFLGGSMGVAEGERIARAFTVAAARRLPVVSVAASGGARMQEGTSALIQMQVVASAIAGARAAGIPHIAVAGDPTTGGVWSSLVASADVLVAVTGARVSFSGSRTRPTGADPRAAEYSAEGLWERGLVDEVLPAEALRSQLVAIIRLLSPRTRGEGGAAAVPGEPDRAMVPAQRPGELAVPAGADDRQDQNAWDLVMAARSPGRARTDQWLAGYFGATVEIRGDRAGGVDPGIRCGFGAKDGRTIAYIAQTGQATTPAGFRTASRLLGLAERWRLPVLTLIDTSGAAAGPADEAAGLGPAIAELLIAIASARVPVTSLVIGEGVSGGAIALAAPGSTWMAPAAYLAVTRPEYAAAILTRPQSEIPRLADSLRLTPADLARNGVVRGVVRLPDASAAQPDDPR